MHASRPTSSSDPGAFPVHECGMMCSTRRDRSGRTGVSCRLAVDRDPLEDLAVASRSPVRRRCALRSRHHLRPAASDQHLGQESERHRRHPVADSHRHTVRCPRQDRGADDPRTASARSNVRRQLHPGVVQGAGDECPGTHQNPSPVCGAEAERRSQWPGPAVDAVVREIEVANPMHARLPRRGLPGLWVLMFPDPYNGPALGQKCRIRGGVPCQVLL